MGIKFSVIIPAYNAEKTIIRCLNSILYSKRDDIEVLVVNDGSTDNTSKACMYVAGKDCRIKYYEKQNGGVSSARNLGLSYAEGTFVCFVDSDDFVSSDYFEQLDRELQENCDLLLFQKKIFDGTCYKYNSGKYCCYYDNREETVFFLSNELRAQNLNAPFNKVYKLDLIRRNNIKFPENLHIGEDKVFVMKYLMTVVTVKCIDAPLYIVSTENKNSLSRKARADLCDSILLEHSMMFETVMHSELSDRLKEMYLSALSFSFYRSAYTVIGEIDKFELSVKEKRSKIKDICRKYSDYNIKKYCDFQTGIIALPIKLGLVKIIDFMLKIKK